MSLGGKINTFPPSLPPRCTHQTNRENVPSNTHEEYFRRAITNPFFYDMISYLNNRFSDVQHKAIMALSILPSVFMTDHEADSSLEEELIELYYDDLPNPSTLQQELHMWKCKWKLPEKRKLPDLPSKSLEQANEFMFPNIHIFLHLICILSVTSCECGAVSVFFLASKRTSALLLGQERMTGLALMHINYGMELNLDDIINIFAGQHQRRIAFCRH